MKFGLMMPSFHPAKASKSMLAAAESIGVDSVWAADHMLGPFPPAVWDRIPLSEFVADPDALFDPFALCAWAAATTDLPLGTCVTDSIRRAAPDVARTALTLQHLCRGGFNLGIGSGERENLTPFGYSFDKPVTTTEHFLRTLRHIIDSGTMPEGPGRFGYPTAIANGRPKIWLAGHRRRMLRLTGEYADGWLPFEVADPAEYHTMGTKVVEHAERAGRPAPERGLLVFAVLGRSRERLRELFDAHPMAKLLALWAVPPAVWRKHGLEYPGGSDIRTYIDVIPHEIALDDLESLLARTPFELLEEGLYLGNAEEVAPRLAQFAAAGCEHLIVMNFAGIVGGLQEAIGSTPELAALRRAALDWK
ncbi:LLM class flavin-dependent oxidoreductase [Nocardia colli]|uniref:LLM class flavin-dependent oxidoreductase n=1 Tax=Nocardia colli TaxID=2545717 RepID=A0A5N0DU47_9NOCA|nr:LLM class flavin-dependent oxidoreductase [Nocardia colli]KAA8880627.1 LLM class flavin-dependent oxidoreductase [Nocardia colli]